MKEEEKIIAVIGSGYWGKNLVRNYYELGSLRSICDKDSCVLGSFEKEYPDVEKHTDFDEILQLKAIKGVVIATPAETHYFLAKKALLSGKHVYVEKPLVLKEDHAKELIEIADQSGLILMVGHLLQYHPVFVTLKELIRKGDLGRINYIYSNRLNLGKIRREENILWSFAPHDISMILSIAGEKPHEISATGGYYLHKTVADVTTTHLNFPSGLRSHIFVSWLHPYKEQKLVVVGDQKMAVFDDTEEWRNKLLLYPHKINWENQIPVPRKATPERVDIQENEPLKIECSHFIDCIKNNAYPMTDGTEGLNVLKVLNASQESLNNDSCNVSVEYAQAKSHRKSLKIGKVANKANVFIHPSAVIDEDVSIGSGTKIWNFSHLLSNSTIGADCTIGQNVVIGPDVRIGKQCKVQNNVSIYKGVTLEDGVFCGPSMVFTNIFNPRAEISKMSQVRPTLVKKGATIGANATIICGATLGRYSFIGAGAVVLTDVADHALVVGNPAKWVGWVCRCGEKLSDSLSCNVCKKIYILKNDIIEPKNSDDD